MTFSRTRRLVPSRWLSRLQLFVTSTTSQLFLRQIQQAWNSETNHNQFQFWLLLSTHIRISTDWTTKLPFPSISARQNNSGSQQKPKMKDLKVITSNLTCFQTPTNDSSRLRHVSTPKRLGRRFDARHPPRPWPPGLGSAGARCSARTSWACGSAIRFVGVEPKTKAFWERSKTCEVEVDCQFCSFYAPKIYQYLYLYIYVRETFRVYFVSLSFENINRLNKLKGLNDLILLILLILQKTLED